MIRAFFIHLIDNYELNDGRNIRNDISGDSEQEAGKVSRDACGLNWTLQIFCNLLFSFSSDAFVPYVSKDYDNKGYSSFNWSSSLNCDII